MNATIKTILQRRSTRLFDAEKSVPEQLLPEIVKAGAYAPSAMNAQAWHFSVVENKELLLQLNDATKSEMANSDVERIRARTADNSYNFYYHAPVLIIVSMSDKALFPREDTGCCMQNMMLAAQSVGLGSCWINQLGNGMSEKQQVRQVLDLMGVPQQNKVYAALALGYAVSTAPLKDRVKDCVNFVK